MASPPSQVSVAPPAHPPSSPTLATAANKRLLDFENAILLTAIEFRISNLSVELIARALRPMLCFRCDEIATTASQFGFPARYISRT
jgi:hypothetical protein